MAADTGEAAGPSPVRRRVTVRGHVQGVWFRDSTRRAAEAAGVAGWVRNVPDGTVEAELQGPPEQVAQVVAFCQEGPPRARVEDVDVVEVPVVPGAAGFEVR